MRTSPGKPAKSAWGASWRCIGIILRQFSIRGEMVWNGIEPAGGPWLATAGITLGC